jgi:hypothetical protein
MRFNVENVPKTEGYGGPRQGWHSFWSRDVRDYLHTGWEHSVELDMFEAWPFQENYPEKGISFSGALHHWIHSSVAGTSKNKDIAAPIAFGKFGGGTNQAYRLDSDWHTYAALWQENYVAWYMDDSSCMRSNSARTNSPSITSAKKNVKPSKRRTSSPVSSLC